ncbi:MAG TPA: hypothetical protein VFK24_10350 [Gammaproteobacteria bacterium]|nr:hypothetical protein [Gammaproteobacteria bacterium]
MSKVIPSRLSAHQRLPEPQLSFHPDRPDDRDVHPLKGLLRLGPYSQSALMGVVDPIRIATIVPPGLENAMGRFLNDFDRRHLPKERKNYLPEFPGFKTVFGVRLIPGSSATQIRLPSSLDVELQNSQRPHLLLADHLTRVLAMLEQVRAEFDAVLIALPRRWEPAFEGTPDEDFDLHDYLKAVAAMRGIPFQIVRESSALSYFCRCSVIWRQSIALYTKAGGIPWKLADTSEDVAFIGLSYALRSRGAGRFVTCCSQVFDADGAGLEFVAYETDEVHVERHNPFLSRSDMRRVVARSLALYRKSHAGRTPVRLVIHKSTDFKPEEVDGCFDAWGRDTGLELYHIQKDAGWRGMKLSGKRRLAPYPCDRGSVLQLSGRDFLLWTQGDAPDAATGKSFFKEGKGIPSPLLIRRFAGHGDFIDAARFVLGLTKMNWNNDSLYDRLPVTIGYAHTLASIVKRVTELRPHPYHVRFFM